MKAKTIFLALILLSIISCKKDEIITPPNVEVDNAMYYPTNVGSYWIYDWYSIESNGVETPMEKTDSVYISSNVVINNKTYAVSEGTILGNFPLNSITRDSSGYIVDQPGDVQFSYVNFTDSIAFGSEPAIGYEWYHTMNDNVSVNVPAGSFTTQEAEQIIYNPNGTPLTTCGPTINLSSWYSPGIGKVQFQTGTSSQLSTCGAYFEARLVRYHVVP